VGKSMQEVGRRASTSMNPNENLQLLPQWMQENRPTTPTNAQRSKLAQQTKPTNFFNKLTYNLTLFGWLSSVPPCCWTPKEDSSLAETFRDGCLMPSGAVAMLLIAPKACCAWGREASWGSGATRVGRRGVWFDCGGGGAMGAPWSVQDAEKWELMLKVRLSKGLWN
jgi:hypothetical protein